MAFLNKMENRLRLNWWVAQLCFVAGVMITYSVGSCEVFGWWWHLLLLPAGLLFGIAFAATENIGRIKAEIKEFKRTPGWALKI